MDVLIVMLAIIYFVVASSKKNGKKSGVKSTAFSQVVKKTSADSFRAMGTFIDKINEALEDDEESERPLSHASPAKLPAKKLKRIPPTESSPAASAAVFEAQSISDDQGCIGGSLPHTQHEGESREEHTAHMRHIQAEEQIAARTEDIAHELHTMNLQQLRRAVIVSEILGKPKAFRKR